MGKREERKTGEIMEGWKRRGDEEKWTTMERKKGKRDGWKRKEEVG